MKQVLFISHKIDCPRKESERMIGVMELTKRLWDAKGYAERNVRKI